MTIKKKSGFTLIETLVAMMILSTGIILLVNSWTGSFMRLKKTQINNEVTMLLEKKMVEIDLEYKGKSIDSIPEEKEDDFGTDYPSYRWKMTSKEFEMPDLSPLFTAKEGGADQNLIMIMKQFSEHLNKTVKEVKVSVFYKTAKKELEYSVTTYYVDYAKELPLPNLGGG